MIETQASLQAVRLLNQALEETRQRLGNLGSQSVTVQGSVSQALGRVRGQVRQLGATLVPVANVGLNLFSRLLSLLQPVARGLASVVTTLFGAKWAGRARELGGVQRLPGPDRRGGEPFRPGPEPPHPGPARRGPGGQERRPGPAGPDEF